MPGVRLRLALSALLVAVVAGATAAEPASQSGETSGPATALFDHLDLDNPRLVRVRMFVRNGDFAAARQALTDHFRTRRVRPGFWPPDLRSANTPDDIIAHRFSFYGSKRFDAGSPIGWDRVYLDDRELTYALNRHQHLKVLASAYEKSRDAKYVREFVDQINDWIERNPLSSQRNWAAWRDLETATRIGVWSDLFFEFVQAPEFTPADQARMLASLHEQTAWLAPQVRAGRSDWSISVATGLAAVGVLFPEFRESNAWRSRAYGELVRDMDLQFYADGSHEALSTYRHNACLSAFWLPLKFAVENRVALTGEYRRTLERMCEFQAYIRRPDGNYPPFNASDPQDAGMLILAAGRYFGRKDFAYIATGGREGTAPTSTSLLLRQSGVAVMRDGWTRTNNYMAIDAGPYGAAYQHEDKLSFELAAFGRTVLVDPGRYSLDVGEPMTEYLVQTAAHNTITIDGSGQRRSRDRESWRPEGNDPITWISQPTFDYFTGVYSQGFGAAADVKHRRRVLFVKDGRAPYWVIADRVEGAGRHLVEARFQFTPGTLTPMGDGAFRTAANRGNLSIALVESEGTSTTPTIWTGSRSPYGGWVSEAYRKIEAAPQLIYARQCALPADMVFVLVPSNAGAFAPKVRLLSENTEEESDALCLELDFSTFTDTVFVDHDLKARARTVGGCQINGCIAVVRKPAGQSAAVLFDTKK